MRDFLPPEIISMLSDRYIAGVANAEAGFPMHQADEDSLTGALGQSIAKLDPFVLSSNNRQYEIAIDYQKVRGRGRNAPEKLYGADGIFQIRIFRASDKVEVRKGLPFQAKKNWKGKDSDLMKQSQLMQDRLKTGLVIDYSDAGYKACTAQAAVAANGNRRTAEKFGAVRSLGQILGKDFLECTVGSVGLFFEAREEKFFWDTPEIPESHLVTTRVVVRSE